MSDQDSPSEDQDRQGKPETDPDSPKLGDLEDPRIALPATVEKNERIVRDGFWPKLRRLAGRLPFVEDLVAAYVCAMDPQTPWHVKAVLLAALAYFVMPIDLIPDLLVGLGYVDDAGVIIAAMRMVSSHITPDHRAEARRLLGLEEA